MRHNDVSLSLKVPHELKDKIAEIAEQERRTPSYVVRMLLALGIRSYGKGESVWGQV